jgi:hypothetical protein
MPSPAMPHHAGFGITVCNGAARRQLEWGRASKVGLHHLAGVRPPLRSRISGALGSTSSAVRPPGSRSHPLRAKCALERALGVFPKRQRLGEPCPSRPRSAGAGTGGGPARSISEREFVMGGTLQIAVPELRCPTGYPAALRRRQSHGPRRDAVRPIDR